MKKNMERHKIFLERNQNLDRLMQKEFVQEKESYQRTFGITPEDYNNENEMNVINVYKKLVEKNLINKTFKKKNEEFSCEFFL